MVGGASTSATCASARLCCFSAAIRRLSAVSASVTADTYSAKKGTSRGQKPEHGPSHGVCAFYHMPSAQTSRYGCESAKLRTEGRARGKRVCLLNVPGPGAALASAAFSCSTDAHAWAV